MVLVRNMGSRPEAEIKKNLLRYHSYKNKLKGYPLQVVFDDSKSEVGLQKTRE